MRAKAASSGLLAIFLLATIAALVAGTRFRPANAAPIDPGGALLLIGFAAFAMVGALLTWKRPENSIGWMFLVGSVAYAVSAVLKELGFAQQASASPWVIYGSDSLFFVGLLLVMLVPAVFPTGRFLSRRWRWIGPSFALGLVLLQLWAWMRPCSNLVLRFPDADTLQPDCAQPVEEWFVRFPNPMGFTNLSMKGVWAAIGAFGPLFLVVAVVAGVISLFVRYRRGSNVVRAQLRWLVAILALLLPIQLVLILMDLSGIESSGVQLGDWLAAVGYLIAILGVPLAIGIAITKYRLYDIDVIISKTVTYGVLAAFITGVYALVVVGVGSLFGGG